MENNAPGKGGKQGMKRLNGRKTAWIVRVLCVCAGLFLCAAALASSGVERDEDGGVWDYDRGIYTDPSGGQHPITPDGVSEDSGGSSGGSSTSQGSGKGGMVINTGEQDSVSALPRDADGGVTIESGTHGIDIEIEPTRAPLTEDEWEARLAHAAAVNGASTPTVYRDPYSGQTYDVEVVYMGIGRSMILLNGQETLVNTVDLKWQTEVDDGDVLAVIRTPKNGYAAMYAGKSKKTTLMMQCRMDSVVRVISKGKSWTLIDFQGTRGYVQTSSLEFYENDHVDFEPGLISVKGRIKGRDTANVRSNDKTHRVLADYQLGTPVTVFDVVDDWAEIDVCGWHCSINVKFLTMEKDTASAD